MGLISIALGILGFTADTVQLIEGFKMLIEREKNCLPDQLFKSCFGHAVKQLSSHLASFAVNPASANITIDPQSLEAAIAEVEKGYAVITSPGGAPQAIREMAPKFRASVIIPGHQLSYDKLNEELSEILVLAFDHFIMELPAHPVAFRSAQVDHILRTAEQHEEQKQTLDRLVSIVEEIRDKQMKLEGERPDLSPTMVQLESTRPEFRNPFRIVTAENFDHDYRQLAQLFMQPSDYDHIRSHENLLITGGRGCGKSMILKSMSAIPAVEIERLRRGLHQAEGSGLLTFPDSGLDYFGVYIKLFRGYFSEYTPDAKFHEEEAHVYFQHFFNCLLLRSLIEALQETQKQNLLVCDSRDEHEIAQQISLIADWTLDQSTSDALISRLRREENEIGRYMTQLRLNKEPATYQGKYTIIDTFLSDCCTVITKVIPGLRGKRIYFLLDEFENLAEFQQKVVNTLAKLRPTSLSLKIATRSGGLKSNQNLQGEAMQFPRDYQFVSLDYDVEKRDYASLLLEIGKRRLEAEGFAVQDLKSLLEKAPKYHPATEAEVSAALDQLIGTADIGDAEARREKQHQWFDALVFRLNQKRQKPWTYAGFDVFVQLSSGIISNFIELCKMAFYMADWEEIDIRRGQAIPWRIQNEAVYKTSQAASDWISKNIAETGPAIARFVTDLGAIIRAKLLGHTSEPEAARVSLKDPEGLERSESQYLAQILDDAIRWSVLQTSGPAKAYLPKHRTDIRPNNYYPNRILAPHLRISPKLRWTIDISSKDLIALVDEDSRISKRSELIKKHGLTAKPRSGKPRQDDSQHPELFKGKPPPE